MIEKSRVKSHRGLALLAIAVLLGARPAAVCMQSASSRPVSAASSDWPAANEGKSQQPVTQAAIL